MSTSSVTSYTLKKLNTEGSFFGSSSMVGVVSLSHPASSLHVSTELTSRELIDSCTGMMREMGAMTVNF